MGLVKSCALKNYCWTNNLGVLFVQNLMPKRDRDRHKEIRANLHFSNNLNPLLADNKGAKICPMIERLIMLYQRSSSTMLHQ